MKLFVVKIKEEFFDVGFEYGKPYSTLVASENPEQAKSLCDLYGPREQWEVVEIRALDFRSPTKILQAEAWG